MSDFSDDDIRKLLSQSKLLDLKRRKPLYVEGSRDCNIYFLLKGTIRGYSVHENREIVDIFFTDNHFIANYDSIFLNLPSRLTLECITPCSVFSFPKDVLFGMVQNNPELPFKICTILASYIRDQAERLSLLTRYPVATKSYLKFKELSGNYSKAFPNKDVASYLGITAEALTRIKKKI